jgi:2-polyprenyl-6-hydroxyphenyl methylase/3-demethylubiquinone-9 3-methyltransferase
MFYVKFAQSDELPGNPAKAISMLTKDRLSAPWERASTVDPDELERFAALAEEWWKPDGKFKTIHRFNPVRCDYIVDQVTKHFGRRHGTSAPFSDLRILDVGCGAGLLCEPLAARGADVVGIDATARNVEVARWYAAQSGHAIDYRHCLAEDLLEGAETFDVVLNTEVIEHVRDQRALMAQCCALVRPGGVMIVATINRTVLSFLLAILAAEHILKWLPKGTHDWRRFVRPEEINALIAPHGFDTAEIVGVSYSPLSGRWRITNNPNVNYMLVAART